MSFDDTGDGNGRGVSDRRLEAERGAGNQPGRTDDEPAFPGGLWADMSFLDELANAGSFGSEQSPLAPASTSPHSLLDDLLLQSPSLWGEALGLAPLSSLSSVHALPGLGAFDQLSLG